MTTYLDCWTQTAAALFHQALAGEPELVESFPQPFESESFGFAAKIEGCQVGRFAVIVESGILDLPLLGEGRDQKAAWGELLREVAEAAAGEFLARTGKTCRVAGFEAANACTQVSQAFQLRSADRAWTILVRDEVTDATTEQKPLRTAETAAAAGQAERSSSPSPGLELLLDVELEATLRFGCREMPLGEILELGPGDVVELDRQVSDPVDLIVGDKIVARGDVVLVNGNFGLRVTEVAAPRKRLESIRCLF